MGNRFIVKLKSIVPVLTVLENQKVIEEIKFHGQVSLSEGNRASGKTSGAHVKRATPGMIEQRRFTKPKLSHDL